MRGGTHTLIAKWAGDSVITGADINGSPVIVNVMDYTLQAAPPNLIIKAGQSGTTPLNVIPLGGSTQILSFTCGAYSADINCTFSPSTLTLDGIHAGSVNITVNTKLVTGNAMLRTRLVGFTATMVFAGLLIPFGGRKRFKNLLGLVVLFAIGFYAAGCGDSSRSSGTAPNGT